MNIWDLIISASISGIVGAITGIVSSMIWKEIVYSRPAKKIFCKMADDLEQLRIFTGMFSIPEHAAIMDLSTKQVTSELHNIQEITSTASARSLSFVLALLISVRSSKNLEVVDSEKFRDSDLDSNIICIGGPLTNKVTRRIYDSENGWLPYKYEEGKIKKVGGIEEWTTTRDVDHGIVMKTENPFSPQKWILIFFGLSGDASLGAAYYFQSRFRNLVRQFGDKHFGIVVRIDRRTGYMSAIQVDSTSS